MTQSTSATITLRYCTMPPLETEAEVIGQWAIHLPKDPNPRIPLFTVTHVPTGKSVKKSLTQDDARSLARRLEERVPPFETTTGEAWLKAAAIIKEIIGAA